MPDEFLGISAGRRAGGFSVDQEMDRGLARMVAAPNEEIDVAACDLQLGRSERPLSSVAFEKRVDEAFPKVAADGLLPGKSTMSWRGPEGLALDFPITVVLPFEIGQDDVGLVLRPKSRAAKEEKEERRLLKLDHGPFQISREVDERGGVGENPPWLGFQAGVGWEHASLSGLATCWTPHRRSLPDPAQAGIWQHGDRLPGAG